MIDRWMREDAKQSQLELANERAREADLLRALADMRAKQEARRDELAKRDKEPKDYQAPKSMDELKARYAAGERYFADLRIKWERLENDNLILSAANFSRGTLDAANLRTVNFADARFDGATLTGARFERSDLTNVSFLGCDMHSAAFEGAVVRDASFEDADLRGASGLEFDGNSIHGAKFSRQLKDLWSELARTYTGTKFFINLLLLLIFVVPLAARVSFWSGVNRGQRMLAKSDVAEGASMLPCERPVVATTPCMSEKGCEKWSVAALVVGVNHLWDGWIGILQFALASLLLIYNIARGWLTWRVGPMLEEQLRSGYTPSRKDYEGLGSWHLVMKFLVAVAVVSLMFHAWHAATADVWLPK